MWSRLSPKTRRNVVRVLPFGVIWLLFAQVFLISDFAALGSFDAVSDTAISLDPAIYVFATISVALVGCLVGAIELLFLNRRLARLSLGGKLVAKTAFYAALLTAMVVVLFPVAAAMEMDTSLADPEVWRRLVDFMGSRTGVGTGVQLTTSLVASLFYAEISEHLGPHVLTNFLTGRYHTPREERRVFLFSDMKSSTTHAEHLGHDVYFDLLRDYYDTLADAIVDHGGQVYQYVGDEIVVSWPEDDGILDGACVRCVLRMKRDLLARAPSFQERYGIRPDFKAGLQVGAVTIGEIGALKKEIVFTGDVLNQTARIQSMCGALGVDLVVGDELASRLEDSTAWTLRSLGRQSLRGKERSVELFAVETVES